MTQTTRKELEALPDSERSELVVELARRVALSPHDLPDEADFVASADQIFTELDRRELPELASCRQPTAASAIMSRLG